MHTYTRYADALIRAHKRGVTVYVAQNGEKSSSEMDRIRTTLGRYRWHVCRTTSAAGVVEGCLSTRVNSYMHAKALTFSQTGTRKHVVVDGTTNMTNHGYENNDMVVTAGDPVLYYAYRDWFADAFHLRKDDDYLTSTTAHAAPRPRQRRCTSRLRPARRVARATRRRPTSWR